MENFARFRSMIAPVLIQVLYWLLTIVAIVSGIALMVGGETTAERVGGLVWLILGPLLVRVWAELSIITFRVLEALVEIRDELRHRS